MKNISKGMGEDIIPYYPCSNQKEKEPGFYYNRDNGWYEIWWPIMPDDEPEMIATIKEEKALDTLLMEVLSYWSARDVNYSDYVIVH